MKNIILGSGISGLIANNILNDVYLVIERNKKSGGDFVNFLGPKYIHDTEETRRFFSKFFEINSNEVKYEVYKDKFIPYDKVNNYIINRYNSKIGYNFKNSMNRTDNKIHKGFFVNDFKFLEKDNIEYNCNALTIDVQNKKIYYISDRNYKQDSYDNLFSTINLTQFADLSTMKYNISNFKSKSVLYIKIKLMSSNKFFDSHFFYNLDDSMEFFRCTKSESGVILEFLYDCKINYNEEVNKFLKNFNLYMVYCTYYFNKYGKVYGSEDDRQDFERFFRKYGIHFIGRNSNYSHDRIQDVILKLEKIKETL